jgi:gas vesicle protein
MSFRLKTLGLEGYAGVGIGFEDAEIEAAPEGEELVQSVQESTELQGEVVNDLATVERLEQSAAGLEDIAGINENAVTEATEGELALTEVAADLATVGTDIEGAAEMVPALESYAGKRISMEGIKQVAKDIWAAIKAFMKKIWEKIITFWRRITDQVPSVVKAAKKLQARAEATAGKTLKDNGKKTKISSSEGRALVVDNAKVTTYAGITAGLKSLKATCSIVLDTQAKAVIEAGDKIAELVGAFDLDKPEDSLTKINTGVSSALPKPFTTKVSGDSRFSGEQTVTRSEHLPGNRAVFLSLVKPSSGSALGTAQMIRSSSASLSASHEKPKDFTGEFEIETLTPSDCDKLGDDIIEIMEILKKFQTDSRRKLETISDKVTKAGEKISSKPDDETTPNALKHYQSAQSYGAVYAKWCSSPYMSLLSHTLATSRTVISVANKSLSQYKA